MSKKMKAKLRYLKKEDGKEGYAIYILCHDGQWGIDSWFPLVAKVGADAIGKEDETDYIHWAILRKLATLQNTGYEIDLDF